MDCVFAGVRDEVTHEDYKELSRTYEEFLGDIFKELGRNRAFYVRDPILQWKCRYHDHMLGDRCNVVVETERGGCVTGPTGNEQEEESPVWSEESSSPSSPVKLPLDGDTDDDDNSD